MTTQTRNSWAAGMAGVALTTAAVTVVLMALSQLTGGYAAPHTQQGAGSRITLPIIIHLSTALSAVVLGPFILARRKGDALHRAFGRVWVALMLTTAIASAFIRAPGGGIAGTGFSFIHLFTIWTLIVVPLAVIAARQGKIEAHRGAMKGLYAGLCIAGAFTLIPGRLLGSVVFG
ncbi:DUF2306 domain-containing protein [Erythrobacter sp. THAF29]|uniref:DUF2306 domain-containing protein n=1 Tax=Erythrobacter sp. THAF29 TaxID=2587851 RepID=UPI001268530D|nr:DUF2306 domain-containing protein [Erythrobacter sp. THAF29]QFT76020.1 hypothetical protein FIU90_00560 [Erythrobacter sp. THAF29]